MAQGVKSTGIKKVTKLEQEKKKVKFPEPGELVSTSPALCAYCEYSSVMGGGTSFLCDYYLKTGNIRGCKCGECDKFIKATASKIRRLVF